VTGSAAAAAAAVECFKTDPVRLAQWRGSNRAVSPRVDDVRATARAMDVVGMIQDARATALGYWQSVR